jgi:hypothetical protein
MAVTDADIDRAVDAYIAAMEAGNPNWKELERKAAALIERRHLGED